MELPESPKNPEIQKLIDALNRLLNEWSDKIPEYPVHGEKYKVSGTWFTSAYNYLRVITDKLLTDNEFKEKIEKFFSEYNQKRNIKFSQIGQNGAKDSFVKTTKEEIEAVERLLREAIEKLENI